MPGLTFVGISRPKRPTLPQSVCCQSSHHRRLSSGLRRDLQGRKLARTRLSRPVVEPQTRLFNDECHGEIRAYGRTEHSTRIGAKPGRYIEREHRSLTLIDRADDGGRWLTNGGLESRAE